MNTRSEPRARSARAGDRSSLSEWSFDLMESKLRSPSARPGIIPRPALVERLLASSAVPMICVVAPPGYGKTTVLAQWGERKGQRMGWVSVDQRDNDPIVLLTYIAVALDRIEPIDQRVFRTLASPGVSVAATAVPSLMSAAAEMTRPIALVLDHVELLDNQECLDAVAELALRLPAGSQLALGSRRTPPLPVALLRSQDRVLEFGAGELAMDQQEALALLEAAGVEPSGPELIELVERTEGWPVGLYLAALALKAGGPRRNAGSAFTGDDRFMADYLRSELLVHLRPELVEFLTRTAVLERMHGPLCDAILRTRGSGRILESLQDSNLLVVPLDRRREWYRYHHLFRELLLAELERREPELVRELHVKAATWYEANGRPEAAIDHAQAAGDADGVARLVGELVFPTYAGGRVDTARHWLAWFEKRGLVERYPPVAVLGAWVQALAGHPAGAERWADAVNRSSVAGDAHPRALTPPDGSTMASYLAMLRALLCRDGIDRMRADARRALAGLGPGSPWRTALMVIQGCADQLDGRPDEADAMLARAVEIGLRAGALPATTTALAERCVAAIERDDWRQAETLAEQALSIVETGHLDDYIMSGLAYAVAARTALQSGDVPAARDHLARAARLRPLLTYAIPWGAVQTLLEMGRAYLTLDDVVGARAVLLQARDILRLRPDLGILPAQVEALRSGLDMARGAPRGMSSLTTAELRLLPLLATHLTFREIGERLYVSKHTVKSQAISLYRKLGVSSRSEAVQRLHGSGLFVG